MYFSQDQNINMDISEDFPSEDVYSDGSDGRDPIDELPFIKLDKIGENPNDSFSSSPRNDPPPSLPSIPPDKQQDQMPSPDPFSCDTSTGPPRNPHMGLIDAKHQHLLNDASSRAPIFQQNYQIPNQPYIINPPPVLAPGFCFAPANPALVNYALPCHSHIFCQCSPCFGCNVSCFGCNAGFPAIMGTNNSVCNQINSVDQMKAYLQRKITGRSDVRFNKKTLHYLYNIFAQSFGWRSLTRTEKRNKQLVFKRLFDNKVQVVQCIQSYPSIIEQVLLVKGLSKLKNSEQ